MKNCFDPNLLTKNRQKVVRNIYYIGCITMKDSDYVKINSVIPLYLMISEVLGLIKEKMKVNTQLLIQQMKTMKYYKKYAGLQHVIKNEIETINEGKISEYDKNFMKIKFDTGDNLPLNKTLKFHNVTIVIRTVFEEDDKFYPQVYLDERLYEL